MDVIYATVINAKLARLGSSCQLIKMDKMLVFLAVQLKLAAQNVIALLHASNVIPSLDFISTQIQIHALVIFNRATSSYLITINVNAKMPILISDN